MTVVSLKSIKHARQLSEETNAFTANVYIDGKKAGHAKNEGFGGSTNVYLDKRNWEFPDITAARLWLENRFAFGNEMYANMNSADALERMVDELVMRDLIRGDIKKARAGFLHWETPESSNGFRYALKTVNKLGPEKLRATILKQHPTAVFAADLTDDEVACRIYNVTHCTTAAEIRIDG
jgi:hypothetical protein